MFPAYTKYEFNLRIVVPGALFSGCVYHLLSGPGHSLQGLGISVAGGFLPAGMFIDIVRDWTGYLLDRAGKKVPAVKWIFKTMVAHFKEYFFYLERHYSLNSINAKITNFHFFFQLTENERYFLATRQAWASFTINMFFCCGLLSVLAGGLFSLKELSNPNEICALLAGTIFFYYAGIYRLIAISEIYNALLVEYFEKNEPERIKRLGVVKSTS